MFFYEIWYRNADLELTDSHMTKYKKIQDGRRPPFLSASLYFSKRGAY